jgi:hypothetical protein
MEEKLNLKFGHFHPRLHAIKNIFFELLDDKAKEIISMKVSKMNGDIRIAFDLIKTSLHKLY